VTRNNDLHRCLGSARLAAASRTRSRAVNRGRRAWRRSTRSCCWRTRISRSLVASSVAERTSRRASTRTTNDSRKSIGGWYGVPGQDANPSFRAPQGFRHPHGPVIVTARTSPSSSSCRSSASSRARSHQRGLFAATLAYRLPARSPLHSTGRPVEDARVQPALRRGDIPNRDATRRRRSRPALSTASPEPFDPLEGTM
jgi:hypothetical protein